MNILMMGTPDFAVPILHALMKKAPELGARVVGVVSQPDRPKGRKQELTPTPLKVAALEYGLPVLQPQKVKTEDSIQAIRDLAPDLIVTAAYGQLLPPALLEIPSKGCINVHASLLPKYRGGAPIHWSIIRGEKETGVTLMHMARGLDTGDMIVRRIVPISSLDTCGSMFDRLKEAGALLIHEHLQSLLDGTAPRTEQDHTKATHAPNITRADEQMNWSKSALELDCQVRGMNPWPVAFTRLNGNVLKVWESSPEGNDLNGSLIPGSIVAVDARGIGVACGSGVLWLKMVQPSGKKAMSATDFARGNRIESGTCFEYGELE